MDRAEFEELYGQLRGSVLAVAVYRVGAQDAQDVCSETFIVAWEKRDAAPSEPGARAAWVAGIARNKAYEALRRKQRANRDRAGGALDGESAAKVASDHDTARQALAALDARAVYARLSDPDRELFELAHVYGLAPRAMSDALGISLTACTTRLSRLRQRLAALADEAMKESTEVASDD